MNDTATNSNQTSVPVSRDVVMADVRKLRSLMFEAQLIYGKPVQLIIMSIGIVVATDMEGNEIAWSDAVLDLNSYKKREEQQ